MLHSDAMPVVINNSKSDAVPNLDLTELFWQHYPRIYNYLRYRVSAVEDAEDLISTIFELAFKKRAQFDPDRGTFSAWLFRIAHNELVSHYRKRKSQSTWEAGIEPPTDLAAVELSPESRVIEKEAFEQMLQGIAQLNERDQEIISLKFAGQLGNKEIGQIMGMKEKTVSVTLLRAVRRLRQQIEKEPA